MPKKLDGLRWQTIHRRSQDFSGVHIFSSKSWPFLVVTSNKRSKTTNSRSSKSSWHSKKCPKNWLLLCLGVQIFCELRLKNFFLHPGGGAGAPTPPPGYAYATIDHYESAGKVHFCKMLSVTLHLSCGSHCDLDLCPQDLTNSSLCSTALTL